MSQEQLDRIEAQLAKLTAATEAIATMFMDATKTKPASEPRRDGSWGGTASERELDSQYGNPDVRKDPPRWEGESYKGSPYSQCSPEYLDSLAGFLEWQAGKDEEKGDEKSRKYAGYKLKDAARARGWAKRLRDGWTPPASQAEEAWDDGVPMPEDGDLVY